MRAQRAKRARPIFDTLAQKLEADKKNFEESGVLWNQRIEEFLIYDSSQIEDGSYTNSCPPWVINKYLEDYWDVKFEKYFEKISCPVLMIPSQEEWETAAVKASIENYQRHIKTCEVALIPGGLHAYVAFQYPQEFSKLIHEFYSKMKI